MVHVCNPSTREAETVYLRQVQGQPGLHTKLLASQGYSETSSQGKNRRTNNKAKVNYQVKPCEMIRIFILCVLFSGEPQHILCETSLMEALLAGVGVSSCSTHHALTLNRTALKLKFQDKFGRGHTYIHRWQNCELLTN